MNKLRYGVAAAFCLAAARLASADDFDDTLKQAGAAAKSSYYFGDDITQDFTGNTKDADACINMVAMLYNSHYRTLALRLLELSEAKVSEPQRLRDLRLTIANQELDYATSDALIRADLAAAAAKGAVPCDSTLEDPLFRQRYLPGYIAAFHDNPADKFNFALVSAACGNSPDLEALYRERLTAVPNDEAAAQEFVHLCLRFNDWDTLLQESALPPAARAVPDLLQCQAQALIALHRPLDALLAVEKAARLPTARDSWMSLAGLAIRAGERKMAAAIALKFGPPGSAALARMLAQAGDRAAFEECATHPASDAAVAEFYELVEISDIFKDKELTQRLLEQAERHLPEKGDVPATVRWHYRNHGLAWRLADRLLPADGNIGDDELRGLLTDIPSSVNADTYSFFERHEAAYGKRWPFLEARAMALKADGKPAEAVRAGMAIEKLFKGSDLPGAESGMESARRIGVNCLLAANDPALTEAWLKDHPDEAPYVHRSMGQIDKAIADAANEGDADLEFRMLLEYRSVDEAASFVRTLELDVRDEFEMQLLQARGDTAGIVEYDRRKLALDAEAPSLNLTLAMALFDDNQTDEARLYIRRSVAVGADFGLLPELRVSRYGGFRPSDSSVPVRQLIQSYCDNKVLPQLAADLGPLLRSFPAARVNYLEELADFYSRTGDTARAVEALQEAARANPVRAGDYMDQIQELRKKQVG